MADNPPLPKPPIRPAASPAHAPPPLRPTAYAAPAAPVMAQYVPTPPPPPAGPPSAPFSAFLGWLAWGSLGWLGTLLAAAGIGWLVNSPLPFHLASISLGFATLILAPLGLIAAFGALFEIGRRLAPDLPQPTIGRFFLSGAMIVVGLVGQAFFASYLERCDAQLLQQRLVGQWVPSVGEARGESFDAAIDDASPPEVLLEFTPGGQVELRTSGQTESFRCEGSGLDTFRSAERGKLEQFRVEFFGDHEMLITAENYFAEQHSILGRYRRHGAPPSLDPSVPEEFAADLAQLHGQLRDQRRKQTKLGELIARYQRDRDSLKEELRRLGVQSAGDLKNATRGAVVQTRADELVSVVRDLKVLEQQRDDCTVIIARIETGLRQIDRRIALQQADAGDLTEVTVLLRSLSERLDDSAAAGPATDALDKEQLLEETFGW